MMDRVAIVDSGATVAVAFSTIRHAKFDAGFFYILVRPPVSQGSTSMADFEDPTIWLRLDERTNALDNLEMCSYSLEARPQPIRWKWAILAIHQALYGFAVTAVQGTDALSVLKNPNDPNSQLIGIWDAIRRAKDANYLWPGGSPLTTSPEEDKAIDRVVTEFRNGFEHFAPAIWSVNVAGMPRILRHVLRVINGIAVGTNSVRFENEDETTRLHTALARLDANLKDPQSPS